MIPVLINNPLFRGITPEKLSANLEEISFHTRSYKKGEILARQGDVCNRLVILTKGSVRGEMIDYSGRLIKVEDIASYLLRLYKQQQQLHITLDRSQQELSDYFGVSRPSLARELAHMQEDGLLTADRKQITILQKEELVRLIQ